MVRLLGLNSRVGIDTDDGPREVVKTPNTSGDSGWLIRFFDSSFFCEWIAISYLYKHEHSGVRDYLCNRMYALPIAGIETYLFQLCYMLLHMPSPSLDKYIVDMCSKSLRIAIKVHWFLLAELEDVDDSVTIQKLQERCQSAALNGDWPPLIKPHKNTSSPAGGKIRMFNKLLSSRRLLSTSSPPHQKQSSSYTSPGPLEDGVREGNKVSSDDTDSTLKVFKKLLPGPKVREAFLKKFREKEEEDGDRPKDAESENFFRRLFRDKEDEERAGRSEDFANPDGFFRRLFRDKHESDDRIGGRSIDDDEKEGFFRKLFRDKHDDRDRGDAREKGEDDEKISMNWEDDEVHEFHEFSLFKRFFRVHPEDESLGLDGITGTPDGSPGESFFKRLFKDREDSKFFSLRREDGTGMSPSNFLKRLFKDRGDEDANMPVAEDGMLVVNTHINTDLDVLDLPRENFKAVQVHVKNGYHRSESPLKEVGSVKRIENCTDTSEDMEFADALLGDRKLFFDAEDAIHRDEPIAADKISPDPGFCKLAAPPETPPPVTRTVSFTKLAGSPLRKPERTSSKPPLPRHSTFRIRKGTYHATLDFVQSLCDTSTGLADVFPMEDRRKSLQESLQELNDHLVSAENDGGVCFPMGRGLCRVVHIPEDEAVLLNSREKAPFLICVEVLRCDSQRPEANREGKEIIPRRRGGIPLANSDVQFPRPPPWAFPTWNHPMQHPNTEQLLRTASKAIDQALAQLLDSKLKVVDVTLSVKKRVGPRSDSVNLRISDNEDALVSTSTGSRGEDELRSEAGTGNSTDGEQVALERSREETSIGGSVEDNKREDCADQSGDRGAEGSLASVSESGDAAGLRSEGSSEEEWVTVVLTSVAGLNMEDVEEDHPVRKKEHRRVPSTIAMAEVTAAAAKGEAPAGLPVNKAGGISTETQVADKRGMDAKATDALAGELWEHKKDRIRKTSKFGSLADWDLCSMIVKSGDDCRQEHLAVQLVAQFYDIFQEAGLPLWLRPYEVLVTSSHTALIETIPDTASIHAIKSRNSNLVNLREFFCNKYIEKTPEFTLAQRNFVESMAGYSILCYMLQVKDRHNGNLLLDEEGHIIHIDFGFMLSNSPGGVNFESAPFKLTRELLEVMDSDAEGKPSEFFDYFKVLCIQGFLLCRKHAERIILLVEMMQDSGCPCFKGGPRTIQNLRKRFHLNLTEQQCVSLVLSLIDNSLDAWRTRQYDYYQRVLNGIL
ncbi:phosphatidylinositol 4-kinase B [Marchantia polymorpha subsp. ruderalis]|uniref:1-phosphatidylinositol 4-kinase n=2 Tax=Marchantia polymorpha TaxID=3197 RepID=A0A176W8W1_MARPO|nr:hypothetical protein AXG93_1433s1260 [Marchantia polymorpha subsp. ruderalis]PTQ33156.1 hypothetical protein MARPO_0091s0020 [Marchantia polymorpha]PTQ33157.1 hypothetical protein MARPO_0091s0020 [Marchantia polymorpha]BBN15657.1 hypothetical protein Mp_6g21350 [Marchantia polymorpha subsp. ruderalis]BBN15658.1 hypothetical protein Mp_6g21350 [Marchantia polymorpha subsp. ruderalis]|eukprot:PTQ33156.1 hypothetical protein MARPO_0091s0020 [Marchantia polymorpha]